MIFPVRGILVDDFPVVMQEYLAAYQADLLHLHFRSFVNEFQYPFDRQRRFHLCGGVCIAILAVGDTPVGQHESEQQRAGIEPSGGKVQLLPYERIRV